MVNIMNKVNLTDFFCVKCWCSLVGFLYENTKDMGYILYENGPSLYYYVNPAPIPLESCYSGMTSR